MTETTLTWYNTPDEWLNHAQQLNNAQLVAYHFKGTDWVRESIAALIGNMAHESSLNPDVWEFGYGHSLDRGYGLVQWTPASKYIDWANAAHLPWDSGDSQLFRIDWEVANNIQWIPRSDFGNMTFAQFRANSGGWAVDYLTEAFMRCYERPNWTAGTNSLPGRKAFASECLSALDWEGTGGGGGSATPSPAIPASPSPSPKTYKVVKGDNLTKIAIRFNTTVSALAALNGIRDKDLIRIGQVLALPNGKTTQVKQRTYTVQKGDNLTKIAIRYGTTVSRLAAINGIKDKNVIKTGQVLKV